MRLAVQTSTSRGPFCWHTGRDYGHYSGGRVCLFIASTAIKGQFDDAGRLDVAANVDLQFESRLGELGRDVAHGDRLAERGRIAAAGDFVRPAARRQGSGSPAGRPACRASPARCGPPWAAGFGCAAGRRGRGSRSRPGGRRSPARLERIDLFGQLVAVERHAGFEPQGVAGAEAGGHDAQRPAHLHQHFPHARGDAGAQAQLEAVLARVAGAADDAALALGGRVQDADLRPAIVPHRLEIDVDQRLQQFDGSRPLDGEHGPQAAHVVPRQSPGRAARPAPAGRWAWTQSTILARLPALTTTRKNGWP